MWKKLKKDLNHYMKVGAYLVLLALPSLGFWGGLNKSGGENTLDPNEPVPWEVVGNPYSHLIETDGYWNTLSDSTQKKNRLEEYLSEYSWDHGDYTGWECGEQVTQMEIDVRGINNLQGFISKTHSPGKADYYDIKANSGKIPFFHVITTHKEGEPHSIGGVPIGEDPLNFNHWYFIDYGSLERVFPGHQTMDENRPVSVGKTQYISDVYDPSHIVHGYVPQIVEWDLEGGEATLKDYNQTILIKSNPHKMAPRLNSLGDIYVQGEEGQSLDPFVLEQLGYNAVPDTFLTNIPPLDEGSDFTRPQVEFTYKDRDTIPLSTTNPEKYFEFTRKWLLSAYLGGVIKRDSTEHKVTVEFTTDVSDENVPTRFELEQNYPNPFNPTTTIEYSVPSYSFVELIIFDITGKEIQKLINREQIAGRHQVEFDGSNLSSGLYLYKINAGVFSETRKMLLLK